MKIAILDSGFRGYRDYLGKALPAQLKARSFRMDGNLEARDSQHGILCGEVIHALAPAAELFLANWEPDDPGRFLDAVRWAREQGARIISCSVIMPSWSDGNGGGTFDDTLDQILGDGTGRTRSLVLRKRRQYRSAALVRAISGGNQRAARVAARASVESTVSLGHGRGFRRALRATGRPL